MTVWIAVLVKLVTHMKSTVEIPDPLLDDIRRYANEHGLTLKAVIELGLRRVLESERTQVEFHLRRATVNGRGLRPEWNGADWPQLRAAAYAGRGG